MPKSYLPYEGLFTGEEVLGLWYHDEENKDEDFLCPFLLDLLLDFAWDQYRGAYPDSTGEDIALLLALGK